MGPPEIRPASRAARRGAAAAAGGRRSTTLTRRSIRGTETARSAAGTSPAPTTSLYNARPARKPLAPPWQAAQEVLPGHSCDNTTHGPVIEESSATQAERSSSGGAWPDRGPHHHETR
jgi:hypothetical protein